MKITALLLSFILCIGLLAGCKDNAAGQNDQKSSSSSQNETDQDQESTDGSKENTAEGKTVNLMNTVTAKTITVSDPAENQLNKTADFYLSLFKKAQENGKNSLVSPLSVSLALAMTANGSVGTVQQQFLNLLGADSLKQLNEFYKGYASGLNKKISVANSIWFKNGFPVKESFLQTNADYYKAGAFQAPFNDQTIKDINNWVSENTDGMIKELVKELDPNHVMSLINTILLKSAWEEPFSDQLTMNSEFKNTNGKTASVPFLNGEAESYFTLNGGTGIVKTLVDGCNFVAILPPEGTGLSEFTAQLTGKNLVTAIKERKSDKQINLSLPKFKYDYSIEMGDLLKEMGLKKAFEFSNEFSGIADKELAIYRVMHKTAIDLNEKGVAAAAATEVAMKDAAAPAETLMVNFDRPFVYFLTDSKYNLPIFVGTVNKL